MWLFIVSHRAGSNADDLTLLHGLFDERYVTSSLLNVGDVATEGSA
jgi:hypothetical protein